MLTAVQTSAAVSGTDCTNVFKKGHLVELVVPYDKVQLLCDIIFYVRDDFSWSKDSQPKFHRTYLPKVHINKNKYENKRRTSKLTTLTPKAATNTL